MKKLLLFFIILFLVPLYGQKKDYITVNTFTWSQRNKVFTAAGKSKLPVGTILRMTLWLNGQDGPSESVEVTRQGWKGYFGPYRKNKKVLQGEYTLKVEVGSQENPEINKELANIVKNKKPEDLTAEKTFRYRWNEHKSTWSKYHSRLLDTLIEQRVPYDKMMQEGNRLLRKAMDKKTSPVQRKAAGETWAKMYKDFPDFKKIQNEIIAERNKLVVHPYNQSVNSMIDFLYLLEELKNALTLQMYRLTGVKVENARPVEMVLKTNHLAKNIIVNAKKILKELDRKEVYWGPAIKIHKETPRRYRKLKSGFYNFRSTISGFNFECREVPTRGVLWGKENSPERLTLAYEIFGMPAFIIQVQMVRFPGFESKEDKIAAWELLATYEWENFIKKSGKFVTLEEELPNKKKRNRTLYEFVFTSQSDKSLRWVKTYIFFHPKEKDLIYGLMYINLLGSEMQGHSSIVDNFITMAISLQPNNEQKKIR